MKNEYLNWKFETDGYIWSEIATTSNNVIIGSDDGFVYCIKKDDGSLKWKYKFFDNSIYDDEDYYDYGWSDYDEYDEYGNEIDHPIDLNQVYNEMYSRDKNDRKYGGSLSIQDDILFLNNNIELHLINVNTGSKIRIINISNSNEYIYNDGFIAYYTSELPEEYKDSIFHFSTDEKGRLFTKKNSVFINILNLDSGKVYKEIVENKDSKNIEIILDEYLVKNIKNYTSNFSNGVAEPFKRYILEYNDGKWNLCDRKFGKTIWESSSYEISQAKIFKDKLLLIDYDHYCKIQLLKIPSLDLIWERLLWDLNIAYPNPISLGFLMGGFFVDEKSLNFFVVDTKSKSSILEIIGNDPIASTFSYLDPIVENGLLFFSGVRNLYQILEFSSGKEVVAINSIKELYKIKKYELKEIVDGFDSNKTTHYQPLFAIVSKQKFISQKYLNLLKSAFFIRQRIKKLTSNDFPNRLVYFGNNGNYIFQIKLDTGFVFWSVESDRWIRDAPFFDGDDIFVGCNNGKFFSFKQCSQPTLTPPDGLCR